MNASSVRICKVESLASQSDLRDFAARCAKQAALYLDTDDNEVIAARVVDAVTASRDGDFAVSFDTGGCLRGLGSIASLPWDSEIYGMKMGVVSHLFATGSSAEQASVIDDLLSELLTYSEDKGFRHLVARVPSSHYAAIHALESHGFRTVGVQVTLARKNRAHGNGAGPANHVTICPFSASDLPLLQDLSSEAYAESRLFADPHLPEEATRRLHRRWIENDCSGRAARVLVAHLSGEPVGYIACLLHEAGKIKGAVSIGDIDLVAVTPEARGKGVASALVQAAIEWFGPRTDWVIVKTQVTNYGAIALYQRKGFHLAQAHTTLHWTSK